MTAAWMSRHLSFQPPAEPVVIGLYIRAVDPVQPDDDDGRRWLHKGRNRWMLYQNGVWSFASVLAERGAAKVIGFLCPVDGCNNIETTPEAMLGGHCTRCNAQTGWPA